MHLLVLDNFDSFTYMLVDYLRQAGADCTVVRNDTPLASIIAGSGADRSDGAQPNAARPFDGVVLSPGPGTPRQAGNLMAVIEYYHRRLPMLGVCLGHQALAEFFGATLSLATRPMHGKVSAIRVDNQDELFRNLPQQFTITRYHSLIVQGLPPALLGLAHTDAGELMAMRHRTWPLWGVQFHPEAVLTEHGLALLKNWMQSIEQRVNNVETAALAVG